MSFQQFNLHPAVLKGLTALGFDTPTPVQLKAIPLVLQGKDAIVQAKTGSGKTFAFGLPILSLLEPIQRPQALVVLPTRELANQVCEAIASISPRSPLRTLAIYGGISLVRQEQALRRGVDIVVGTPGRLKDLLNRGSLDLSKVHILVLDEADEMLDMGFRRDIEYLCDRLPSRKQTLVFSATMPEAIRAIADRYLRNPAIVGLGKEESVSPIEISHHFVRIDTTRRLDALLGLISAEKPESALIFTAMKHETKRLALKLERLAGLKVGFLNGNMSQNARNNMLARFKAGDLQYLVATDVAARGLDIEGLSHVFHYSVPPVVETYIHRSGRTGRAGNFGKAICLVTPEFEDAHKAIRKQLHCQEILVDPATLPVWEADVPDERRRRQERRSSHPRPATGTSRTTPGRSSRGWSNPARA